MRRAFTRRPRRRAATIVVGVAALGWLGLPVMPAHADSTVVVRSGLPQALGGATIKCVSVTQSDPLLTNVTGPATPPLGTGSVVMTAPAADVQAIQQRFDPPVSLGTLTDFSTGSYQVSAANPSMQAYAEIDTNETNGSYDTLYFILPTTASWTTSHILSGDLSWRHSDPQGHVSNIGDGTYAQFMSAHNTDTLQAVNINLVNCNGSSPAQLAIDQLVIGASGTTTTYDFEPGPVLTSHASASSVLPGKAVAVTGTLTEGGHPLAGKSVALWARAGSAKTFSHLLDATSDAGGNLNSGTLHPQATTVYQWRYVDADSALTYFSPVARVTVSLPKPKVTLHLLHAKFSHKHSDTAFGNVSPAHKGTKVTLRRVKGKGSVKLGTAKEARDGSFGMSFRLKKKGHYKVFATAPASKAARGGSSAKLPVKVT